MRNKLKILFLFFIITMISLGCIESQKSPALNETEIATPSITEQKLPVPNATEPLRINGTFETWSRGYYSKDVKNSSTYNKPYFRVITNYNTWIAFLNETGYFDYSGHRDPWLLDGILFPGQGVMPKIIEPADFNNYFIIAAMMGKTAPAEGPEIEIKNITRVSNEINIKVRVVRVGPGALTYSAPYHVVIVKREMLPIGNSTFVFIDAEGKKLGELELNIKNKDG